MNTLQVRQSECTKPSILLVLPGARLGRSSFLRWRFVWGVIPARFGPFVFLYPSSHLHTGAQRQPVPVRACPFRRPVRIELANMPQNLRLKRTVCIICFSTLSILPAASQEVPAPNSPVLITPLKLDFGSATVGEAGSPQTITITNSGAFPVDLGLLISGIDFSQSTNCGSSLAAGASCSVQITFKPATTGPRLGTLTVDASRGNLHLVNLSGTGK